MGRFHDSTADENNDSVVDMSPLIDCVFILLIFFIVTTTFVEETGVEVNKPESAAASDLEKESIMIAVKADGGVYYAGQEIGIGGVQREVKRELRKDKSTPVIIQIDKDATVDMYSRVHTEAQRAGALQINLSQRATGS